ncbi:PREDICTED: cysteine-rich receptor-like protein kinase 42 [Ipomoea nil]|uniref:cysteine-rich receptor-like protein kinase 42 n=1 Tax=Ipomoea nil TaxID=35883 RepID=UPI00090130EF|nr:PREDICTED: cysteine-rich receptor-like protein kinase 42 [Ipomoea nil]
MHFLSAKAPYLRWAIVIILLRNTTLLCYSDPRISEAALICGKNRTSVSIIIPNFVKEMETVSQSVTDRGWGSFAVINANISIYALAQCHQDLPRGDCLLCYAASRTRLPRCLPATSGRLFLDGCFLRYDGYNFFNQSTDPTVDAKNCSSPGGVGGDQEPADFVVNAGRLIDNVTGMAVAGRGFAAANANGVYGLAQCWKTVSREGCRECLVKASREVKGCLPGSRDGRALNAGCYLRYSTHNFIADRNHQADGGSSASKTGVKIIIALIVTAIFMISTFAAYTYRKKSLKRKQEGKNLGAILSSYNKSNLNFKYETLEKATKYFDPSMKLGQGGAGSVFKATLQRGKVVAVKRLFFNTRQWVDEFFNEVNLINGIEHKNLVKLLGCSIEGPESLLVYEFVPNKSLDHYLFEENKIKILTWKERFDIVVGIAEGIAFLHEGCGSRIIHRDIKSSNVLLDENFAPKIADFGLARDFAADKTHLSTGIAGTLGYMAPEYLVKGQLTEKADVYSFGVLVLEIVSGRKNNAFVEDTGSLLQTVWKLYKTSESTQVVDPLLEGVFPAEEASKAIQVGLLCCQASPGSRPSMSQVVEMLILENPHIPHPTQPPFINPTVLAAGNIKSLMSDMLNKLHTSSCTTSSSSSTYQSSTRSQDFQHQ